MLNLLSLSFFVPNTSGNSQNLKNPINKKKLFKRKGKKVPPLLQKFTIIGLIIFLTTNCDVELQFTPIDPSDEPAFDHSPDIKYGLPVLPNISGFGLNTAGGKGGQLIRVTNLNKEGPGSLREAIETTGPRIIVFEVGGVIDLEGGSNLVIREPYVTISGQTAPSPGITLIKGQLSINNTHDVIVQHLAVRTGEAGHAKGSGWEKDAISVWASHDVIIDHCTATWGTDENLSVSGPRRDGSNLVAWRANTSHRVTISNCIIAHGLANSTHSKGVHSMGSLLHDSVSEILIYGNLYAHNRRRNPITKSNTEVAIINNYIYNFGRNAIEYQFTDRVWSDVEPIPVGALVVEGNYIEEGPDTEPGRAFGNFHGPVKAYWHDTEESFSWGKEPEWFTLRPFWPEGLIAMPRGEVRDWVLENVGARPWDRDEITTRMISEIRVGGGRIIDSETEAGGYPSHAPVYREFNKDDWDMATMTKKNGMP
jgi:hypothetical protein